MNRFDLFGVVMVLLLSGAQTVMASEAAGTDPERKAFIDKQWCPLHAALSEAQNAPPVAGKGRFVVMARADRAQAYVQCLFIAGKELLCEASSGKLGPPAGQAGYSSLGASQVARLAEAGFLVYADAKNLQRMFDPSDEAAVPLVTQTLLEVLHDVYGARIETKMRITGFRNTMHVRARRSCAKAS